ncbi:MAG: hypothetical protein O7G88_06795 [bacterium]|nr:hypothetical protein [bacterium]
MREVFAQSHIIVVITLLLTFFQPAYANGGHVHLGGVFFLLLGAVVFIGGLGSVIYFLFRSGPATTDKAHERDE